MTEMKLDSTFFTSPPFEQQQQQHEQSSLKRGWQHESVAAHAQATHMVPNADSDSVSLSGSTDVSFLSAWTTDSSSSSALAPQLSPFLGNQALSSLQPKQKRRRSCSYTPHNSSNSDDYMIDTPHARNHTSASLPPSPPRLGHKKSRNQAFTEQEFQRFIINRIWKKYEAYNIMVSECTRRRKLSTVVQLHQKVSMGHVDTYVLILY